MMIQRKRIFSFLAIGLLSLPLMATAPTSTVNKICRGFLPENNLRPPISALTPTGITKAEFDSVLDKLEALYAAEMHTRGGTFKIERLWNDNTVNAYAYREGANWWISMFGGFARYPGITPDGFAAVACHEIGHHLGGAPRFEDDDWASVEGQSDYYATTKCLKRLFEHDDNSTFLASQPLDPTAINQCRAAHGGKQDQDLCIRASMAALSLSGVLKDLDGSKSDYSLATPNPTVVNTLDPNHPQGQCRVDTYFQGALCRVGFYVPVSDKDPTVGYCEDARTYTVGMRPRCWFAP